MKVFLDSSTLLAASGSPTGASRAVLDLARKKKWTLVSSAYCRTETQRNLTKVGPTAIDTFIRDVEPRIYFVKDRVAFDKPLVFSVTKDRPVVVTALAEQTQVLLTLDRNDFHRQLGNQVYGMLIRTPGDWLAEMLATKS